MMQGIQSLGPGVAEKMAAMGRFEDDQIAHVAEGEVIVPAPILKYYPEVKKQVFDAIKDQGLDPEQFIVGGEMVAINPNTGVQEFGFLSKAFKKIKKIVKKAAPLLIAAALPMAAPAVFGAGTVASAALTGAAAGGLGTLVQGGDIKDAFKAAATGAAIGGIGAGLAGKPLTQAQAQAAQQSQAAAANVDAIKAGMEQSSASTATGTQVADASGATGTTTDFTPPRTMTEYRRLQAAGKIAPPAPADQVTQQMIDSLPPQPPVPGTAPTAPTAATPTSGGITDLPPATDFAAQAGTPVGDIRNVSFGDAATLSDLPSTANLGRTVPTGVTFPGGGPTVGPTVQAAQAGTIGTPDPTFTQRVAAEFKENPLQATATTASLGSTLYGLLGGGGEEEQQTTGGVSAEELGAFLNQGDILNYQGRTALGIYYNPETGDYQDVPYVPNSGIVAAAGGGHIMGPGTGTSDSIPAYLSDGEFVMTADAVKGAGNGDRKKGAAKMYAMMNKFEGMA